MEDVRKNAGSNLLGDGSVGLVLGWRKIGMPAKLCWLLLWHELDSRPGNITVHFASVGYELGRSERSARDWLEQLVGCGLLEIEARTAGNPYVTYRLRDPRAVVGIPHTVGRADDQRQFEFSGDGEPDESLPADSIRLFNSQREVDGSNK